MALPERTCKFKLPALILTSSLILFAAFNLLAARPILAGAVAKVEKKESITLEQPSLAQTIKNLQNSKTEQEILEILYAPPFNSPLNNDSSQLLIEVFRNVERQDVKYAVLNQLKNRLFFQPNSKIEIKRFFWEIAQGQDLALAQEALAGLVQVNDSKALAALVKHLDKHGLARYPDGRYATMPWFISRQIYQSYPKSFTAKGIKDYEKITGQPYFDIDADRYFRNYGNSQYNPAIEIPGWLDWFEKYPGHLASDSAAYRLGRSYEIAGDYAAALNWLFAAINSPNGAIQSDAKGRLMYILDVKMGPEILQEAIKSPKLRAELQPVLEYSLAIKLARLGKYQESVEKLQEFVKKYDKQDIYTFQEVLGSESTRQVNDAWEFWSKVKEQQAKLTELSAYAKQIAEIDGSEESAPLRYQLAALIYGDIYIFYNHFWQGNRIDYNWLGHINEIMEQPEVGQELQTFLKEQNNYYQALQMFQELAVTPLSPDLAEKVDFSVALSYAHLEYYGQEIKVLWTEEEQRKLAAEAFLNYINKYPEGNYRQQAIKAIFVYGYGNLINQ